MSNPSFNRCPEGHFYPASKSACPHCTIAAGGSSDDQPTRKVAQTGQLDQDKTTLLDNTHSSATTPMSSPTASHAATAPVGAPSGKSASNDRTVISRPESNDGGSQPADHRRKLVGWLVSYSLDPLGIDYKLFEGKNTVGRAADNSIKLIQDPLASSLHATILFRNSSYYVQDNMASNPSRVNHVDIDPGQTVQVKDGDVLTFGSHQFLLKSSIG